MGRFTGDILDRTFTFGVRIVKMGMALPRNQAVMVLTRQVMAAGTLVGANLREANHAETRKSFVRHVEIALKECCETIYWLEIIVGAGVVERKRMESLIQEGREIEKILATVVRKSKQRAKA